MNNYYISLRIDKIFYIDFGIIILQFYVRKILQHFSILTIVVILDCLLCRKSFLNIRYNSLKLNCTYIVFSRNGIYQYCERLNIGRDIQYYANFNNMENGYIFKYSYCIPNSGKLMQYIIYNTF